MPEDSDAKQPETLVNNSDRLLQHLLADSLAARLVKAASYPSGGLKKALAERLDQVRDDLGRP